MIKIKEKLLTLEKTIIPILIYPDFNSKKRALTKYLLFFQSLFYDNYEYKIKIFISEDISQDGLRELWKICSKQNEEAQKITYNELHWENQKWSFK